MKQYNFSFNGRQTGAIGIFYNITDSYNASSLQEARSMLYKDYEHITFYSCRCGNKQFTKDEFNKAVCSEFKTDYKGKGSARK